VEREQEVDMLLAKLALGFCGAVALAGVYVFHEGVMRVDADHAEGRGFHVWFPAAVLPMAMYVVPGRYLECAVKDANQWLPTLHALTKELKKYPEVELVEVDGDEHVRIRAHQGKLLIDFTGPSETVHVACPLAMLEDATRILEAKSPGA
jgi:hypothetical protein